MVASRVRQTTRPRNQIRFAPNSQSDLLAGVETLEQILGPTIGAAGRPIVFSKIGRPGAVPELLSDGATIARRMTGLPGPFANMGMMLARHGAWMSRSAGGDAPALSVVIAARALRDANRLAIAGVNRAAIRRGLDRESERICSEIALSAKPLTPDMVSTFASDLARDPVVAELVVKTIAAVGPDTVVLPMESRGRTLDLELIEGSLWETSAVIGPMQPEGRDGYSWLDQASVLIWDAPINDVRDLATCLDRLRREGVKTLIVMGRTFSKEVIGLLALNNLPDFVVVPVEFPHEGAEQALAVADIAALTGATPTLPEAGDRLASISRDQLGFASRVVVGRRMLNITASAKSNAISARRTTILSALETEEDPDDQHRLLTRLGRMDGRMAVIWVGAPTISQRADRMTNLRRALDGVHSAQRGGILHRLGEASVIASQLPIESTSDEDIGASIARRALLAPAWWLARNAGFDPEYEVARISTRSDVEDPSWDVTAPIRELLDAVRIGLGTAAMAITSDVLVHRPRSLHQADIRP